MKLFELTILLCGESVVIQTTLIYIVFPETDGIALCAIGTGKIHGEISLQRLILIYTCHIDMKLAIVEYGG